jgi:hypothetical protein
MSRTAADVESRPSTWKASTLGGRWSTRAGSSRHATKSTIRSFCLPGRPPHMSRVSCTILDVRGRVALLPFSCRFGFRLLLLPKPHQTHRSSNSTFHEDTYTMICSLWPKPQTRTLLQFHSHNLYPIAWLSRLLRCSFCRPHELHACSFTAVRRR